MVKNEITDPFLVVVYDLNEIQDQKFSMLTPLIGYPNTAWDPFVKSLYTYIPYPIMNFVTDTSSKNNETN